MEKETDARIQKTSLGLFFCFISIPDFIYGLYAAGNYMEVFGGILIFSSIFLMSLGLYTLFGKKGPLGLLFLVLTAGTTFLLTEIITYPLFRLAIASWNFYYLVFSVLFLYLFYIVRGKVIGEKLTEISRNEFGDKITKPIAQILPESLTK